MYFSTFLIRRFLASLNKLTKKRNPFEEINIIMYFVNISSKQLSHFQCVILLSPPPLHSLKMISNTLWTICKLFKPLYSLVPRCDFIMFTQSCRDMWIGTTIVSPSPFTTLWFVWHLSFHFWYVHGAMHTSWMRSPTYLYFEKKTTTKSCIAGKGRGASTSWCTLGQGFQF